MFKRILKWLGAIIALLVIAFAVFLINLIWFRPWSLNLFYEKVFAEVVFDHPELLSTLGLVEQFGITNHNGKLDDESPAHQQREFDRWKRDLTQLREYPLDRQSPSQKLSTHVLDWFLQMQVEGEKWQWHNYPVNQLFGVQNQFPSFMANTHRLLTRKDCEYYLKRLDALPKKFDQLLENLKIREQKQILPPRFVVEEVLKEMTDFIGTPASENILASSFKTRAAKIAELSEAQRADFQGRVETAISGRVYPAYQKLIDYFREILPKTTSDDGVWKLTNGNAYYAYCLRENTTTTLNPDEVHALGLREVARIEGDMRSILDANGFAGQPIGEAVDKLTKDARFLYANDDKGRAEALAQYSDLITKATERSSKELFLTTPRAKIEVRRVPEFKEATAPGAYYQPGAMDGTRPGIFFANLRDMNEVPKWLGRLRDELFRAVRLVVDTGIHAKHWTREQAIAYMREKTGMGEKEVKSEIERYIVAPGQACAYKIGMLKIQELRARAEKELGERFDQREFHDTVLKNGALPLEILEEQVNEYIQRKKSA